MIRIRLPSSGSARLGVFSTGQCHETPLPWPSPNSTPPLPASQVGKHGILDLRQVLQRLHRWQATVSTATGEEEWRQGASSGPFCMLETRCSDSRQGAVMRGEAPSKSIARAHHLTPPSACWKRHSYSHALCPLQMGVVAVPSIVADNA